MPRRRLHGITQARRKKKRTRLLKLKTSVTRVQHTERPEAFETTERLEREDLEFLEAMREMDVRRSPWSGESRARRHAVERVQFQADSEEGGLFLRAMDALGVAPLDAHDPGRRNGRNTARPATPVEEAPARDRAQPPAAGQPAGDNGQAADAGEATVTQPDAGPPPAPERPPAKPAAAPTGVVEPTVFEMGEDDRALFEALLKDPGFRPELKFAGVKAPPPRRAAPTVDRERLEPDGQLDLHGKTQEEAIRMVQNFMLVSHSQRLRHVLIITGRGRNSGEQGPVLREVVYRWLERNGRRFVREFGWAPARHGGEGALWVTLR